jgi:D-cysteine desulfhydrase
LKCTLVLRGNEPEIPTGNYLLDWLVDANIEFISAETYKDVDALMQKMADTSSEKCYIIPEGGSNEVGAWGYAKCFQEIQTQIEQTDLEIDTIVAGTGSGGTHAGLIAGKAMTGSDIEVLSVNVCDDAKYFEQKINRIIMNFESRYQKTIALDKNPINIIDGYVGEGYGVINQDVINLIKEFAQLEGIIIDPVYGAKAMLGLKSLIESESMQGRNILFIHTGGIFGIFPFWKQFKI